MPYWYNVSSRQVESHDDPGRSRADDLMGPYDTEQEAQAALDTARRRTEEWDERERRDREWETGDPRDDGDNNPLNG
jgi:hypothetical protein